MKTMYCKYCHNRKEVRDIMKYVFCECCSEEMKQVDDHKLERRRN